MKPVILVVDDEEDTRSALRTILTDSGYQVEVAADGEEALKKASASRPALVITDLVMPDIDGMGLMTALRRDLPRVPVTILTGFATVDGAVAAMREGAYDYLTKPVDMDRLHVLLEKALDKGRTLQELAILRRRASRTYGEPAG
jgi:two-component system response regulator AtoC